MFVNILLFAVCVGCNIGCDDVLFVKVCLCGVAKFAVGKDCVLLLSLSESSDDKSSDDGVLLICASLGLFLLLFLVGVLLWLFDLLSLLLLFF